MVQELINTNKKLLKNTEQGNGIMEKVSENTVGEPLFTITSPWGD